MPIIRNAMRRVTAAITGNDHYRSGLVSTHRAAALAAVKRAGGRVSPLLTDLPPSHDASQVEFLGAILDAGFQIVASGATP